MRRSVMYHLAFVVVLSGCSTSPTDPSDASAASVVIAPVGAPGKARVVVRRDSGMLGVACGHAVRIDGKIVGNLASGEELAVTVAPGEHTIEASTTGVWCGANAVGGLAFTLNEGQAKAFRTGFYGMFNLDVTQIGESTPKTVPETAAVAPAPKPHPKPTTPSGQFGMEAAKYARDQRCASFDTPAQFVAKGPGFETYSVPCANGDTMMVRCDFGVCRALR